MASGDVVGVVIAVLPPAANFATPDTHSGGSSPAEVVSVYDFDGTSIESLDLLCVLRNYGGGGLTIRHKWTVTAVPATEQVRIENAIRRFADDAEDLDAAHTYSFQGVSATVPSAAGEFSYDNVTLTDGAQMDNLANGELFILRTRRDPTHVDDNWNGNDAELTIPVITET